MKTQGWLLGLAVAATLHGCACADECEIGVSRCLDELTLEICELDGPDQLTPVTPDVIDCVAPNARCEELPGGSADCVLAEKTRCGPEFEPRCEGSLVVYCSYGTEGTEGLLGGYDCADQDGTGRCGERPDAPGSVGCL